MKRAIAGVLLLVGMSVAPALAWDGGGDRGLRRDMRHDERKIEHDRRELRRDLDRGDYRAATASAANCATATAICVRIAAS